MQKSVLSKLYFLEGLNLKVFSLTGIILLNNILIQRFERLEYKTKAQVKCKQLENGKIFEFLWSQGYLSG